MAIKNNKVKKASVVTKWCDSLHNIFFGSCCCVCLPLPFLYPGGVLIIISTVIFQMRVEDIRMAKLYAKTLLKRVCSNVLCVPFSHSRGSIWDARNNFRILDYSWKFVMQDFLKKLL